MARPNLPALTELEKALRREAELQQHILADRLLELGIGDGGGIDKGTKQVPPGVDDPIAIALERRLGELRAKIAAERRRASSAQTPPNTTNGGWEMDMTGDTK
jgi:hypothetical protein